MGQYTLPESISLNNKEHVYKLQEALFAINFTDLGGDFQAEIANETYGSATEDAVRQYQLLRNLPENINYISKDFLIYLEKDLKNAFRVCGTLRTAKGLPVINASITVYRSMLSQTITNVPQRPAQTLVSIANIKTLSNGDFCAYLSASSISSELNLDGGLKRPFMADLHVSSEQDESSQSSTEGGDDLAGSEPIVFSNIVLSDYENIVNISSENLASNVESEIDSLTEVLSDADVSITQLSTLLPDEIAEVSKFTDIDKNVLIRLILNNMTNDSILKCPLFAFLQLGYPTNVPRELFVEYAADTSNIASLWAAYKNEIFDITCAGLALMSEAELSSLLETA